MLCQTKDLHGLTALRSSLAPPVLPGDITAQILWLWSFHACCLWGGFDLPNFACTIIVLYSWEGQGSIRGIHKVNSNSVHICKLIKCMNELLSTWNLASIQCYSSVPFMPCNIPSFPVAMLPVPSMAFGVVTMSPAFLCLLCGLWKKLVCSSCCAADCPIWPAKGVTHSHWAARILQTVCSVTNRWAKLDMLLLCCHFIIALHCIALHIFCKSSLRNEERSTLPTSFFLPLLTAAFFLDGGRYLVLIAELKQKAVTCGTSSYEAAGVWGFTTWVGILYHTCEHIAQCILDSSGCCAVSWLWRHMEEVNGNL